MRTFEFIKTRAEAITWLAYLDETIAYAQSRVLDDAGMEAYSRFINDRDTIINLAIELGKH